MRVLKVSDINELDDAEIIRAFKGKVVSQFKRSTWENDEGSGSFENLVVTDSSGEKIKVVIKDREPVGNVKGKAITLLAHQGNKGWSGCYAHDNTYKGKTTREIKVTATGEIVFGNNAAPQEQEEEHDEHDPESEAEPGEEDYAPQPKAKQQQRQTPPPPQRPATDQGIKRLNKFFLSRANAMIRAYDATVYIVTESSARHPDAPMSDRLITALTLALYNSGCYQDGLYDIPELIKMQKKAPDNEQAEE